MKEPYYIIRDLLGGGFWNSHEQSFGGIKYAYEIDDEIYIEYDEELQNAMEASKCGVELVKVYK